MVLPCWRAEVDRLTGGPDARPAPHSLHPTCSARRRRSRRSRGPTLAPDLLSATVSEPTLARAHASTRPAPPPPRRPTCFARWRRSPRSHSPEPEPDLLLLAAAQPAPCRRRSPRSSGPAAAPVTCIAPCTPRSPMGVPGRSSRSREALHHAPLPLRFSGRGLQHDGDGDGRGQRIRREMGGGAGERDVIYHLQARSTCQSVHLLAVIVELCVCIGRPCIPAIVFCFSYKYESSPEIKASSSAQASIDISPL
jgi:hypothetical protein